MLWGSVGLIVVILCIFIWFCPLVIHIRFSRVSGDDEGRITIHYLFGLIRVKRVISSVQARMTPKGPQVSIKHASDDTKPHQHKIITANDVYGVLAHIRGWMRFAKRTIPIMRKFWSQVHVRNFQLTLTIGTGDSVTTGMAVGAIWGMVGCLIGAMSHFSQLDTEPKVEVVPAYYGATFQITFESIIKVRAGYAISAAFRLLRVWKRRTSDGTSNSGSDADGNGEYSRNGRREHDYRRSG